MYTVKSTQSNICPTLCCLQKIYNTSHLFFRYSASFTRQCQKAIVAKSFKNKFHLIKTLIRPVSIFHKPFWLNLKAIVLKNTAAAHKIELFRSKLESLLKMSDCLLTAENCFHIFQARLVNCLSKLPFFSRVTAPNPILFCWQPCLTQYLFENNSRTGRCK